MRISLLDYTWPQRFLRLGLLALLSAGGFWFAGNVSEEFRVSCERRGTLPDCRVISARWGRSTQIDLPDGALRAARVVTRTDIDRDGTPTTYIYLALETRGGEIVSASQDGVRRAAEEINAFLGEPTRPRLDVSIANRWTFRAIAAIWSAMLVYLLCIL